MIRLNARRKDPTRTTMLVNTCIREMNRRFRSVRVANRELIVDDDALGLSVPGGIAALQQVPYGVWRFQTNANKVKSYRKWLKQQVDAKILTTDATGRPWMGTYVWSAYRTGVVRAFVDANKAKSKKQRIGLYAGTKEQFLMDAFAMPEMLSKIELIYTRAYNALDGVTAAMDQKMSKVLADGLANGWNARRIASVMAEEVDNITKRRAHLIARTELIYAHAEGQLDSFGLLGVDEVGLEAEWSTAGDKRVCGECEAMEGAVFPVDEAHGLIPRHPSCRCSWLPAMSFRKEKGQLWGKAADRAVKKSIGEEYTTSSFREAQRKSTWPGKLRV